MIVFLHGVKLDLGIFKVLFDGWARAILYPLFASASFMIFRLECGVGFIIADSYEARGCKSAFQSCHSLKYHCENHCSL